MDEEDSSGGHFAIESYIPISFLQVFMWERFREYSPEPLSPDASRKFVLDSPDLFSTFRRIPLPCCSCWLKAHTLKHQHLEFFLDDEQYFIFRPFVSAAKGFARSHLEISVSSPEQVRAIFLFESSGEPTALHPFLITFPGRLPLLSLELEFRATHYFPHRVRIQFGLNQGIPTTPSLSGSLAGVFHTFLLDAATLLPSLRGTAVYLRREHLSILGKYDFFF